jgi:hypothetical protein
MKKGSAKAWSRRKLEEYDALHWIRCDWPTFVADARRTFGDVDRAATARLKLSQVSQGNKTADEYHIAFMEHAANSGLNEVAQLEQYKKGLNGSLLTRVYSLDPVPNTLAGMMSKVSQLDRQWHERQIYGRNERPFRTTHRATAPNTKTTTPSYISTPFSAPPAQRTGTMAIKNEPKDEVLNTVTCYNCGGLGHYS